MLAGMLNVLVIYDAWAGPLGTPTDEDRRALKQARAVKGGSRAGAPPRRDPS
jgi:hypothetical protein